MIILECKLFIDAVFLPKYRSIDIYGCLPVKEWLKQCTDTHTEKKKEEQNYISFDLDSHGQQQQEPAENE